MARISSLRSIPAGVGSRPRVRGHTQVTSAAERTRLEGERARLEQEVAAWQRNQARAEQRLRLVEQQLAALGPVDGTTPEPERVPAWPTFTFEY